MDVSFLKSNRFWALVVAGLSVAAEGGFTTEAFLKGLGVVLAGFVTVRTVDRLGEKVGQ